MTVPVIDWASLSDDEVQQVHFQAATELDRRSSLASIPTAIVTLNAEYLDASGVEAGQEWRQPTGAHDAYPKDWVVTHEGLTWRSLVDGNVWEPGVANWVIEGGGEWPAWVQPSGSADAYPAGAKVSHVERHWISQVDANVWEPGAPGSESLWIEAT